MKSQKMYNSNRGCGGGSRGKRHSCSILVSNPDRAILGPQRSPIHNATDTRQCGFSVVGIGEYIEVCERPSMTQHSRPRILRTVCKPSELHSPKNARIEKDAEWRGDEAAVKETSPTKRRTM